MSEMVERLQARVFDIIWPLQEWDGEERICRMASGVVARAVLQAMRDAGDTWNGLARRIMMWLDMDERHTPRTLLMHLARSGVTPPQWLLDEPEMKNVDHVMSKGTRCVLIYRAMLETALEDPRHG